MSGAWTPQGERAFMDIISNRGVDVSEEVGENTEENTEENIEARAWEDIEKCSRVSQQTVTRVSTAPCRQTGRHQKECWKPREHHREAHGHTPNDGRQMWWNAVAHLIAPMHITCVFFRKDTLGLNELRAASKFSSCFTGRPKGKDGVHTRERA